MKLFPAILLIQSCNQIFNFEILDSISVTCHWPVKRIYKTNLPKNIE